MVQGGGSCPPPDFGAAPQISVLPPIGSAQITAVVCIWQWGNFSNIFWNSLRNFFNILINLSNFIKVF